ncbi:hypothetical protein [Pontiella sp.]|uniref:hypothetical protein n=1 Tax=Pontiella sp. TaxID=2837462 RepID=UPI003561F049
MTLLAMLFLNAASFADNLRQAYEKAYFLETAKGQTKEALEIYREILQQEPTEENREQLCQAANRLVEYHRAQQDSSFAAKLKRFNMHPRFYDHITRTFGEPETAHNDKGPVDLADPPDAYTLRYPNGFHISVKDNEISEYRFTQPHVYLLDITVGSDFHSLTNRFKPRDVVDVTEAPEKMKFDTLYHFGDSGRLIYTVSKNEYFELENGKATAIVLKDTWVLKKTHEQHPPGCRHMREVPLPPPSPDGTAAAAAAYAACVENTNHTAAIEALRRYTLAVGDPKGETIFDKVAAFNMKAFPVGHIEETFGEPAAYLRVGNAIPKKELGSFYTLAYLGGFGVAVHDNEIEKLQWNQPGTTFSGVGIGSTSEEVLEAFPPIRKPTRFWKKAIRVLVVDKDDEAKTYRATPGLTFRFFKDKVSTITITDNRALDGIDIQTPETTL